MPTQTAELCSCGIATEKGVCQHCDRGCAFCNENMYQLCERNAAYNKRTTARLQYELMPLVHGFMG